MASSRRLGDARSTRVVRHVRARVPLCALAILVAALVLPVLAQEQPTQPFAPQWGLLSGWGVFVKKGCGKCHALRGFGGGAGPDLGRIETGTSFFALGAAMWNHLPRMGARMREVGIDRPTLSARELSDLIAFLFTAQYYDELGDAAAGEKLYLAKECVRCHEVGGKGGKVGPPLDGMRRANSPVLVAAAMWNHGPAMATAMHEKGSTRPTFQGKELVDLIAYIVTAAKSTAGDAVQVVPGTPEHGEKLFAEKACIVCHAVAGKGGTIGPDLGRARVHVGLTRFAALMWNHGPAMWERMRERGIEVPKLGGQEMADILAYLYVSYYFDRDGSAAHGQKLVRVRGCIGCHSVRGKGGRVSADFATSGMVGSPPALIAAMWNHASFMESEAEKHAISWPILDGRDLADIAAYLGLLVKPTGSKDRRGKSR